MSVISMTGCGRGTASAKGIRVDVDVSTVNRKQLDVRVQIPRAHMGLENDVVELIKEDIARGSVSVSVKIQMTGSAVGDMVTVDKDLAAAYLKRLRSMGTSLTLKDDLKLSDLVRLPEILKQDVSGRLQMQVRRLLLLATGRALAGVRDMRQREGRALAARLRQHLHVLEGMVTAVREQAPIVMRRQREGMIRRLGEIGVTLEKDDTTLQKELLLFADRSDITEELTRLKSHLEQFTVMIRDAAPKGRSMDFLCQELLREINTVGSKSNDTGITRNVVAFKAELEALREQVQNLE